MELCGFTLVREVGSIHRPEPRYRQDKRCKGENDRLKASPRPYEDAPTRPPTRTIDQPSAGRPPWVAHVRLLDRHNQGYERRTAIIGSSKRRAILRLRSMWPWRCRTSSAPAGGRPRGRSPPGQRRCSSGTSRTGVVLERDRGAALLGGRRHLPEAASISKVAPHSGPVMSADQQHVHPEFPPLPPWRRSAAST